MPFHSPTNWHQAEVAEQGLALQRERLRLDEITAFLVGYPEGVILSTNEAFFPLPQGVGFVEPKPQPPRNVLDPSERDEGQSFVTISFSRAVVISGPAGGTPDNTLSITHKKTRKVKQCS